MLAFVTVFFFYARLFVFYPLSELSCVQSRRSSRKNAVESYKINLERESSITNLKGSLKKKYIKCHLRKMFQLIIQLLQLYLFLLKFSLCQTFYVLYLFQSLIFLHHLVSFHLLILFMAFSALKRPHCCFKEKINIFACFHFTNLCTDIQG